jgi:hypothetical protein
MRAILQSPVAVWPPGFFCFGMWLSAVEIFCLAREPSAHVMLRSNMPSQNLHMRSILRPPSVLNFTF